MTESFINIYSVKAILGKMARDIQLQNNLFLWRVGKKHHFMALNELQNDDLALLTTWAPSNFHYLTPENLAILKQSFQVEKSNSWCTCIKIQNLHYTGRKYHGIRGAINKNKKHQFTIASEFRDIKDVETMLDTWSLVEGEKYFQDHSGKNVFFFNNNFHQQCYNYFCYHQDKLIAFSVLSPGNYSNYIIGKALCHQYPGLSEYMDAYVYQDLATKGVEIVNLGQSVSKLANYKNKFPNSYTVPHFNGNIYV